MIIPQIVLLSFICFMLGASCVASIDSDFNDWRISPFLIVSIFSILILLFFYWGGFFNDLIFKLSQ